MPTAPSTSASLLGRLAGPAVDEAAWAQFVDRYAPVIYDWCRQWRLQPADAEDVTQAVLVRLVRRLQAFHYDPALAFRKWLWTVARHAWFDYLAECGPARNVGTEYLAEVAAREDLLARLDGEFDRERLEEASARVRLRVEPRTWDAFRLTAVEGLPGVAAARRLGMSVAAVFKAKSKVLRMLREELRRLDGRPDPGDDHDLGGSEP